MLFARIELHDPRRLRCEDRLRACLPRLARRGVEVEMPLRRSTVHERDVRRVLPVNIDPTTMLVRLREPYVRAIAERSAHYMPELEAHAVGPFEVAECLAPPTPFEPGLLDAESDVLRARRADARARDECRRPIEELDPARRGIAIGNHFDGVHRGANTACHQRHGSPGNAPQT